MANENARRESGEPVADKFELQLRERDEGCALEENSNNLTFMDDDDDPLDPDPTYLSDGNVPPPSDPLEPVPIPPPAPGHSEFTIRFAIQMIRTRYGDVAQLMATSRTRTARDNIWRIMEPRWAQSCERIEALEQDRWWRLVKPVLRHSYSRPEDRDVVPQELVYAHRLERMVDALATSKGKTAEEVSDWRLDQALQTHVGECHPVTEAMPQHRNPSRHADATGIGDRELTAEDERFWASSHDGRRLIGWDEILTALEIPRDADMRDNKRRQIGNLNKELSGPIKRIKNKPTVDRGCLLAWWTRLELHAESVSNKSKSHKTLENRLEQRDLGLQEKKRRGRA